MEKAIVVATKAICEAAVSITTIVVLSKLATKLFIPGTVEQKSEAKPKYSL